jgi:hypothetical protein
MVMLIRGSHRPLAETLISGCIGMALCGAMTTGCSSTSAMVQQAGLTQPSGSVRLEEIADWEFEAAHPTVLEPVTLESLLRAVMITDMKQDSPNLPVDGSQPMRVFSDEDVRYLAPLLAQALSQAQPEHVVAFRLSSSAGSGSEPTAGTLYVRNEKVYLTISEHRGTLAKVESSLFRGGRPARLVTIDPESAGQIEPALPSIAQGRRDLKSLTVDYRTFVSTTQPASGTATMASKDDSMPQSSPMSPAQVMVSAAAQPSPATMAAESHPTAMDKSIAHVAQGQDERMNDTLQQLQEARQAMARKDAKISALRRDLESMREQLEARDKELRAVKHTKQTQPRADKRNRAELTVR